MSLPPSLPSLQEFAETVDTMRRLQRTYFQTRDREVLGKSKRLEAQVDALLVRILAERRDDGHGLLPLDA